MPEAGFGWGLLVAALLLGLRHGIDWDHIAAITDISATQRSWRRGILLGSLYAAGHAVVVFLIGAVAIVVGRSLPGWVDELMGRFVGVTLLVLGVYVVYSLLRDRGDFRPRSRWMIVLGAARSAYRWASRRSPRALVDHDHAHVVADGLHHDDPDAVPGEPSGTQLQASSHAHPHRHDEAFTDYRVSSSLGVGMLHGIGAETPTQVLVFLAAASAGGVGAGLAVLTVFLIGLFAANTAITLMSSLGFHRAGTRQRVFAALGVVTAAVSILLGVAMLSGQDAWLPALLAG